MVRFSLVCFVLISLLATAEAATVEVACHCWVATQRQQNLFYAGHALGGGPSQLEAEASAERACRAKPFLANEVVLETRLDCVATR